MMKLDLRLETMVSVVHEMIEERGMRIIVGRRVDEILGTEKVIVWTEKLIRKKGIELERSEKRDLNGIQSGH